MCGRFRFTHTLFPLNHVRQKNIMASKKKRLSPRYQVWIDARVKFRLSDAHIQMARELGLNPKKFGSLANHDQERWKSPLPDFIEDLYHKRYGVNRPEVVMTIEQIARKKKERNRVTEEHKQSTSEYQLDIDEDDNPF